VGLVELDSLRVWLERRAPELVTAYPRRPPGFSCREVGGPYVTVSWCEGVTHLRMCWRYRGGPWYCAELAWPEVRRLLAEYRGWLREVVAGWRGL
jgi:hypothetical protein